jgi:hypothetical protein
MRKQHMADKSKNDGVETIMRRINRAWLEGRINDLAPLIHPGAIMVLPGFAKQTRGHDSFLAGFREFTQNATIHKFHEHDYQIDRVEDTAVVNYTFEMIYEHSGERFRSTGRDLWIFRKQGKEWLAVWRTMLDLEENTA